MSLWRDKRGVAAIEFAFFVTMLAFGILITVNISSYIYQGMEVQNATEVAAQAGFEACDLYSLPATTNCSGFMNAVTTAMGSTSLGTSVSLQSGYPSEGYYCVNGSGTLQLVANVGTTPPSDCSSVGGTGTPVDYIQIKTTFDFNPPFPNIPIASLLPTQMTGTSWMRMD